MKKFLYQPFDLTLEFPSQLAMWISVVSCATGIFFLGFLFGVP